MHGAPPHLIVFRARYCRVVDAVTMHARLLWLAAAERVTHYSYTMCAHTCADPCKHVRGPAAAHSQYFQAARAPTWAQAHWDWCHVNRQHRRPLFRLQFCSSCCTPPTGHSHPKRQQPRPRQFGTPTDTAPRLPVILAKWCISAPAIYCTACRQWLWCGECHAASTHPSSTYAHFWSYDPCP